MDAVQIVTQFVAAYYQTFDKNDIDRKNLAAAYRPHSTLDWEGQRFSGLESIINKISTLNIEKITHQIGTMDIQPSGAGPNGSGMIALITGAVTIDSPNPLHFTQMFHFVADEGGNFYILNDMHRLIYG